MSTPDKLFLYVDDPSARSLATDQSRVLLLGGYLGYPNFGDILQLKGAIDWHRRMSGLEPVVLCDLAAVTDEHFTARLRSWFGTVCIVYMNDHATDATRAGLRIFSDASRATHLHVYGGGFLNRLWGPRILRFAELLHERFGVGHYVMSGQQAEEAFVPQLRKHFQRCRPVLVGGRDDATVKMLTETGVPAAYSFDDAAEQMQRLAAVLSAENRTTDSPASHGSASTHDGGKQLLLHLNASAYAIDSPQPLDDLAARLIRLLDWASNDDKQGGQPAVTLLNAYNDARVRDVSDTLGTVQRLDDRFPLADYRVIHLGRLAYELSSGPGDERVTSTLQAAPAILPKAGLAMTCSYHAAMLCMMLEIPVWLETRNEYYRQKAAGLGLPGIGASSGESIGEAEFEAFLKNPRTLSLAGTIAARTQWLDQLRVAYTSKPTKIRTASGPSPNSPAALPLWIPKGGVDFVITDDGGPGIPAGQPTHSGPSGATSPATDNTVERSTQSDAPTQSDGAGSANQVDELRSWCAELEQAKAWLESQLTAYKTLAEERERSIKELKVWNATLQAANTALGDDARLRSAQWEQAKQWLESQLTAYKALAEQREKSIEELKTWNATLQAGNASLGGDVREHKTRADLLAGELLRATNELAQARTGVTWLEQQSANWQARAQGLEAVVEHQQASLKSADEARTWLDEQRTAWEATARRIEGDVLTLKEWIQELENAKKWLAGDRDKWKTAAEKKRLFSLRRSG